MPNWKGIVGKSYSPSSFYNYCSQLHWINWRPSFCVVHNTASPTLKDRPNGFNEQHIKNLENYYKNDKEWSAGPHLFIDDRQIWVFTPLTVSGVHSPSWNSISLGIEMLGNYDTEDFLSGRGLKVQKNTIAALKILHSILGIDAHTLKLHKEDPLTSHACPGIKVRKLEIIQQVMDSVIDFHVGEHMI